MNKVRRIRRNSCISEIELGFLSIIVIRDRELQKNIKETNTKLKNYCVGKGSIFEDNANIKESCLNNSKLHLIGRELLYLQKIFTKCFLLGLNEKLFNIQL